MVQDFDIGSLAQYLHLSPQQVERLASRGELPARKVAGKWRFSPAEIHHWMEQRMGLLDNGQLAQVEGALERSTGSADDAPVLVGQLMPIEAIAIPLAARTRGSVVTAMSELAANTGALWDPKKMAEAVRNREAMQSTALDNGVALLHPRRPLASVLAQAVVALGRTSQGIPFGGTGALTDIFFLICSTNDREHLRILARLSRMIADNSFVRSLREAPDAQTVHQMIEAREEAVS